MVSGHKYTDIESSAPPCPGCAAVTCHVPLPFLWDAPKMPAFRTTGKIHDSQRSESTWHVAWNRAGGG